MILHFRDSQFVHKTTVNLLKMIQKYDFTFNANAILKLILSDILWRCDILKTINMKEIMYFFIFCFRDMEIGHVNQNTI